MVLQVYRAFIVWSSSWCVISAPFAIFVSSVGASTSHETQMYELLKVYLRRRTRSDDDLPPLAVRG